ncbi:MAG: OmpA family protein, partial [Paracoccaceae bacterium]
QPAVEPVPEAPSAEPEAAPETTEGAEAPSAEDLEKALSEEPGEAAGESSAAPAAEPAAEPEAEPAPGEVPAAEAPADTEPAAEAPAEDTSSGTEATPSAEDLERALAEQSGESGEAPSDAAELPVVTPATADIVEELAADGNLPSTEVVPDLPVQPEAETGEAPVAEAAQVLTEAADGTEAGSATAEVPAEAVTQVTEEEVTADTARSSSEDFGNKVNEAAGATKAAKVARPKVVERKKGLSDTEKLLLLGAGALVVGAILSNNRKVEMNSGDRVIVSRDGQYYVLKDDDALLRQPGSKVRTETFRDGSTRTTVTRPDGSRIVTIRDAEQRVLRRVHVAPDGRETLLIDDLATYEPVVVTKLPKNRPRPVDVTTADEEALRAALATQSEAGRRFSLSQVRNIWEVRSLVPVIDLDTITFESGSAAIRPDQAKALAGLGKLIQSYIRKDPSEVFLIEGHTDAVGSAAYNLALSDRRAESVALALTEYFGIPPENMVVQGYGEEFLKVASQGDERANRRASVRRITSLLR